MAKGDSDRPPVFIVGAGRSGTTLVRLMLDSHSEMAIPWESHFIPQLFNAQRRYLLPSGQLNSAAVAAEIFASVYFRGWQLPEKKVWKELQRLQNPSLGEVIEAVFVAYARHKGKVRWGDKTPHYVHYIPLLASLFPSARFIHVVRDGRDVALSVIEMDWGPNSILSAAEFWKRAVANGRHGGSVIGEDRYFEMRYEDLLADPEKQVARLCSFVKLEFDPRMLHFSERGLDASLPPERHRWQRSVQRPLTKGLRNWSSQMSPADVAVFETVAGNWLERLGYRRAIPNVPLPVMLPTLIRLVLGRAKRILPRMAIWRRRKDHGARSK